jgi:hypothetical protein
VRMVSHGDEDAAGARLGARGSTLLATVLATGPAPKLSGDEADWETFSYDWKMYVEFLMQSQEDVYRMCNCSRCFGGAWTWRRKIVPK